MPLLFVPGSGLKKDEFLTIWRDIQQEEQFAVSGVTQTELDKMMQREGYNFVAKRSEASTELANTTLDHLYYSCKTITDAVVTIEVAFNTMTPTNAMVCSVFFFLKIIGFERAFAFFRRFRVRV